MTMIDQKKKKKKVVKNPTWKEGQLSNGIRISKETFMDLAKQAKWKIKEQGNEVIKNP